MMAATTRRLMTAPLSRNLHIYPFPERQVLPLQSTYYRLFSEFTGGADLLQDALQEKRPKIVLDAYAPTGFDVSNMTQKVDKELDIESSGDIHMTGSILAFDRACFLWNFVESAQDVTYESLAPVLVYRPKLKYLFIGCNTPLPQLQEIKTKLKQEAGIVCEQLTIHNAMGTFNILNGEDRSVAVALVLEDDDEEQWEWLPGNHCINFYGFQILSFFIKDLPLLIPDLRQTTVSS